MQAVAPAIQLPISVAENDAALTTFAPLEGDSREETSDEETYDIEAGFLSLLSSFDVKQPPSEPEGQILDAENDNRGCTESSPTSTTPQVVESMSLTQNIFATGPSEHQRREPLDHEASEGISSAREPLTSNILPLTKVNAAGAHEIQTQDSASSLTERPALSSPKTAESAKITSYEALFAQQTGAGASDELAPIVPVQKPETPGDHLSQDATLTISPQLISENLNAPQLSSPIPSSISPALMLNQVVSHLRENLTQGSLQQTLTLTLIPAELGQITINASFEGASLSLAFQGLPATLDLLKTHQGLLLQNLSTQGIVVHQSNLSFNQNTSHGRDGQRPDAAQDPPPVSFKKLRDSLHRLKQGLFA